MRVKHTGARAESKTYEVKMGLFPRRTFTATQHTSDPRIAYHNLSSYIPLGSLAISGEGLRVEPVYPGGNHQRGIVYEVTVKGAKKVYESHSQLPGYVSRFISEIENGIKNFEREREIKQREKDEMRRRKQFPRGSR